MNQITVQPIKAYKYICSCGYSLIETNPEHSADMSNHLYFGHPASRNPEITCRAEHYDYICSRIKDHNGKHYAIRMGGGFEW
jgi:hypothetical protein